MKISVIDDTGSECFSYDTDKNSNCLHPSQAETPKVVEALQEATRFLAGGPRTPLVADAGNGATVTIEGNKITHSKPVPPEGAAS